MWEGRHLSICRQPAQAPTASSPLSFWAKSCVCVKKDFTLTGMPGSLGARC